MEVDLRDYGYINSDTKCSLTFSSNDETYTTECLIVRNNVEFKERIIILGKSTSMESLPYDVLIYMIETGDLSGKDLLGLCLTSSSINVKCNARNQLLFKKALMREYGIKYNPDNQINPREEYIMRSSKREMAVVHIIDVTKIN